MRFEQNWRSLGSIKAGVCPMGRKFAQWDLDITLTSDLPDLKHCPHGAGLNELVGLDHPNRVPH